MKSDTRNNAKLKRGTNESDQPDSKMSKNEAVTFQNSKSMDSYRYGKLLSLLSSNDGADNLRKLS